MQKCNLIPPELVAPKEQIEAKKWRIKDKYRRMKEYETLQVKKWSIHNVDGFLETTFNLLLRKPTL